MNWTVEAYVLLSAAVLFAGVPLIGLSASVRFPRMSEYVFMSAAILSVGAALWFAAAEPMRFPLPTWLLPIIPGTAMAIVVRDRLSSRQFYPVQSAFETEVLEPSPMAVMGATDEFGEPEFGRQYLRARYVGARYVSAAALPPAPHELGTAQLSPHRPADDATARARAYNPYTDPSELADLAYSYPMLRAAIAGNPATPATVLDWLAESGDSAVMAAIAARGSSAPMRGRIQ